MQTGMNTNLITRTGIGPLKGFRPDVQALRGLAVLIVVLFHAEFLLPGGFVGVDVFFVISGFVIGRQLFGEFTKSDRLSFGSFYSRRARRILPPLAVMLTAVMLLSPLLAPIGAAGVTDRTGIAAALFSANAYLYKVAAGGYFFPSAALNPLLHTWSLSVEEQFYFVIPALLAVAWRLGAGRRRSLRSSRVFVVALVVVSLGLCVLSSSAARIGPIRGLDFAFFSPFTRAWEFGIGLGLVVLPARWLRPNRRWWLAIVVGVALIGVAAIGFSESTRFPGWFALVPVLGTALVIAGGTGLGSAAGSTHVALRPMIWLGDISYSWYLWHWPVIVFAGAFWPEAGKAALLVAAVVSLVPAWFSYRFLEQAIRARPSRRAVTVVLLTATCIALPIIAAVLSQPIARRISRVDEVAGYQHQIRSHIDWTSKCGNRVPLGRRTTTKCTWEAGPGSPSVVLIGDSNAGHFSEAMIGAAQANGASLEIATASSCPFVDARIIRGGVAQSLCGAFVRGSLDELLRNPPSLVVIANATDLYATDRSLRFVDAGGTSLGSDSESAFTAALSRTIEQLRDAGTKVVVVNVVPRPDEWESRRCSNIALIVKQQACGFGNFAPSDDARLAIGTAVESGATGLAGAELWSFNTAICPEDRCVAFDDGVLTWKDWGHISVAESEALATIATGFLAKALESPPGG